MGARRRGHRACPTPAMLPPPNLSRGCFARLRFARPGPPGARYKRKKSRGERRIARSTHITTSRRRPRLATPRGHPWQPGRLGRLDHRRDLPALTLRRVHDLDIPVNLLAQLVDNLLEML